MEALTEWIVKHAQYAHWFLFGIILLAGVNIPISVDLLIIFASFLAVTIIPEHIWHLYFAIFLGCYFSAWITYGIGRFCGDYLLQYSWFKKLMPAHRINKIQGFYHKYGPLTFLVGRFIPFGVRNCIFMTTGISRYPFLKFAICDLFACWLWTSLTFYILCKLGQTYQGLNKSVKIVNIIIFFAFSLVVIGILWYKRSKKSAIEDL